MPAGLEKAPPAGTTGYQKPCTNTPFSGKCLLVGEIRQSGPEGLPKRVHAGPDHGGNAEFATFLRPPVGLGRRPKAPCEPDLAVGRHPLAHRDAPGRRRDRQGDPEVCPGLVDPNAAGDVDEDVGAAERQARMA